MHNTGNTTHNNRQHPAGIPPSQDTPMFTGTKRKPQRAKMARRVHQPSRQHNWHRTPAANTDAASAPRRQRARSTRWTTPKHSPAPQAAHPTVHHPLTSKPPDLQGSVGVHADPIILSRPSAELQGRRDPPRKTCQSTGNKQRRSGRQP